MQSPEVQAEPSWPELDRELGEPVVHALAAKIAAAEELEAELRKRVADRLGIVGGLLQLHIRRKVLIAIVADHQRNALLRMRGR